jgi:hypothetical protein
MLLTVVLAASTALAGNMPFGVTSPPPPPAEGSATGEMPQGVTSEIDSVTAFTLNLVQNLLALF